MKISIITTCFNSAETIEDTIQSVLNQTYTNIEYIIIDGKSTDATLSIINKYRSKIAKVISEPDKGIYDAMNKGVEVATGEIIGILNSDDLYADKKVIEDVVNKFTKNKPDALYADLIYVDRNNLGKTIRYWKSNNYKKGDFKKGWMPPHPTFFVKKKCYDTLGKYNIKLKSAADYELMLRFIHKNNISVTYLQRVIIKMRVGGQSNVSLKNRLAANKEDRLAWQLNGLKAPFLMHIKKPLRKIGQFIKRS